MMSWPQGPGHPSRFKRASVGVMVRVRPAVEKKRHQRYYRQDRGQRERQRRTGGE